MCSVRRPYQQARCRPSESSSTRLLRLLRNVSRRERGALAEEELFHVLRDELLRFFLPGHQAVLVEDHLHPILPELPRLRGDVVVHPLTELTGPRQRVEAGQLLLKFLTEDHAAALVADRRCRGCARISHATILVQSRR